MSTGCTDRAEAARVAETLLVPAVMDAQADMLEGVVAKARGLRRDAKATRAGRMPLAEGATLLRRWMDGRKDSSVELALSCWRSFERFCNRNGVNTVSDLTPELCGSFLSAHAPRFAHVCRLYCRKALELAGDDRKGLFGEVARIPRKDTVHREPLAREQIAALLDRADALAAAPRPSPDAGEFARLVRTMLYTGLRMGDAVTLDASMVDLENATVCRRMAKTGRMVEFPLHPAMEVVLADAPSKGALFPSLAGLYSRDRQALSRRFSRLFDAAGIQGEPGQYCAHCLRTTFASLCAENGVPLAVIQSWLGHTSQEITRIYARVEDMRAKRMALSAFPDLG
jgi:integrase